MPREFGITTTVLGHGWARSARRWTIFPWVLILVGGLTAPLSPATAGPADCNGNGIPDECDLDCNAPDCGLPGCGESQDCDDNEVLDECEPNGDCNNNGIQDICDIADGTSLDCNRNRIPDECDLPGVIPPARIPFEFAPFSLDWEDFADGESATGTVGLPWPVQISGETFTAFEQDSNGYVEMLRAGESPYGHGLGCVGELINDGDPTHTFLMAAYDDLGSLCNFRGGYGYDIQDDRVVFYWNTETFWDLCFGGPIVFQMVLYSDGRVQWNFDSAFYFQWHCDLFSGIYLGYDRQELLQIYREFIPQQKSWLSEPLREPPDCNENGMPDACDFADGTSQDCNGNGTPDECDIADGLSLDCQGDGIPDECPLTGIIESFWVAKDGLWSVQSNWCPLLVPDNGPEELFDVLIDGSKTEVTLDISPTILEESSLGLVQEYVNLEIRGIIGEYDGALRHLKAEEDNPKLLLWLGSSIGNLERCDAADFLRWVAETMLSDDRLLVGIDLRKERAVLERAYDDSRGVTARFNKNILTRINRE
ncbi:MAG: L-histidine N(alpha)-methyltransferase, partial [Planctomycetes bacterium]|nr:L-histidine N(alpha)-methyltransferase [Planctomycetota bacterium]